LRHFAHLSNARLSAVFARSPQPFGATTDKRTLAVALGATLYTPGTRHDYADQVDRLITRGITSSVLCLEDAISDGAVAAAERNVLAQLSQLHSGGRETPMIFVRVRSPHQMLGLVDQLGVATAALTGFVFPKFTAATGHAYLKALAEIRERTQLPLYGMPVLETPEIMHVETRVEELLAIRTLLLEHAEAVLAVRIGATDLCGLYGLRRSRDLTVYDVALIRDVIAAVVNVFARDEEFVVTGPVWEHYAPSERVLKPQLRSTPFGQRDDLPHAMRVRSRLVSADLDGLLHEVVLDKATGLIGKTAIHPSHVRPIHALYAVTAEEYADACTTLTLPDGGVTASSYSNKMVESKPHARWAAYTLGRAEMFGVLHPDRTFVDLLDVEDVPA
jgi:citrate lyase beta subunit